MSDANFASLSSTLLARKGGAKPAMRPQSGILGPVDGKEAAASLDAPNQVRASLNKIQAQLERPAQPRPMVRKAAAAQGKRAAFTLRLDQERHLMLRLACTVRGRSAQQLVTDALDALLAEMPEIASLAAQVQRGE